MVGATLKRKDDYKGKQAKRQNSNDSIKKKTEENKTKKTLTMSYSYV